MTELKTLNDLGSNAGLEAWVSVGVRLPEKNAWVLVFEDDNPQDALVDRISNFRQRVTPARLLSIDSEGYGDWYLCYVGGGPLRHVRNVTHWMPLPPAPNDQGNKLPSRADD